MAVRSRAPGRPGGAAADIVAPGFVGRDSELVRLTDALSASPALVLVEGEAGIGKSRLVRELLTTLALQRRRILVGACPPFREPFTLGPVVDAVRQGARRVTGLPLSPLAGALRPLFPEWTDDLPPTPEPIEDASAARHRLFRALDDLLTLLRVSVLVVEDVHWADDATLEFLLFLVSRRPQRLSVLVTYRPEDVPQESLLLRLSRPASASSPVRLALSPLRESDTATLASSMLGGQKVSAQLAMFLQEHTDGVPLMVQESVRLLYDRQDLTYKTKQWQRRSLGALQVPATVRDSVLERVRRLSTDAQNALRALAVLGDPTDVATVARVAVMPRQRAADALLEAGQRALVSDVGSRRIAFTHALAALAVYDDMPDMVRAGLHLRAGQAFENRSPLPVTQLVRHFREGGDTETWLRYAQQAATIATEAGDDASAIAVLLDLLDRADLSTGIRADIALALGRIMVARKSMDRTALQRVISALREVMALRDLDTVTRAKAHSQVGRLMYQQGRLTEGCAEIEQAVEELGAKTAEAAMAMAFLGWPYLGTQSAQYHLYWLRRAADVPADSMSRLDRLFFTVDRTTALLLLGEKGGWDLAREIPSEAATVGERLQIARAYNNTGHGAMLWGRYPDARDRLAAGLKLATAEHSDRWRTLALVTLAHLDWNEGRWAGLASRASELVETAEAEPEPWGRLEASLIVVLLDSLAARTRQAVDRLRRLVDDPDVQGAPDLLAAAAGALARLLLADGRPEEAVEASDLAVQIVSRKNVWIWGTEVVPARVEALAGCRRLTDATWLVSDFERGLTGREAPAPLASLALSRAILTAAQGSWAAAAQGFGDAARAWRALPRPYDALLADEKRGSALLSGGQFEQAREVLESAAEEFRSRGARRDAERVGGILHEHGWERAAPARGGRPSYGDDLSPRELEVVRLVATGRTDREIADCLTLSARTVASHLASARRKLRAKSRTALVVAAIERGIIDELSASSSASGGTSGRG